MQSFEQVVTRFDGEIDRARRERGRWGYFPALYGTVTRAVRDATHAGQFDDGERMERFVVHFARLYFDALDDWRAGRRPPGPWRQAFRAAERPGLLVLQHLALGMNAHINHDLPISAAATAPGASIHALSADFDRINDILESLVDRMEGSLWAYTPGLDTLDRTAGRWDEALADFSMRLARAEAWRGALILAALDEGFVRDGVLAMLSGRATLLAKGVARAAPLPGAEHWMEPAGGPAEAIDALLGAHASAPTG